MRITSETRFTALLSKLSEAWQQMERGAVADERPVAGADDWRVAWRPRSRGSKKHGRGDMYFVHRPSGKRMEGLPAVRRFLGFARPKHSGTRWPEEAPPDTPPRKRARLRLVAGSRGARAELVEGETDEENGDKDS